MAHTVSEGIGAKAKDRKIVSKGGPVRARAATEFRSHKNRERSALSGRFLTQKTDPVLVYPTSAARSMHTITGEPIHVECADSAQYLMTTMLQQLRSKLVARPAYTQNQTA